MAREPESRLAYSTGGEREPEPKSAAPPSPRGGIRIRLERRASDRIVTLVTGLPGSAVELARLLRALKSACGAGGTVKRGVLELQGDHRTAAEAFLADRGLAPRVTRG
ncbi:MAG TPA: translation initiation factor [Vicinamibacteria bacterium]|jgi:translation initiation factor 1|nr:translation initiation factor [Vicinamibacteria bacterium]